MCQIVDKLQKYVSRNESFVLPHGEVYPAKATDMYKILLGGDQLTSARVRGAVAVRGIHDNAKDRLKGVVPVTEDWHTQQTLLKVRYIYYT